MWKWGWRSYKAGAGADQMNSYMLYSQHHITKTTALLASPELPLLRQIQILPCCPFFGNS